MVIVTQRLQSAGLADPKSNAPETYIGYRQAENFASPERVHRDSIQAFSVPTKLSLNHWGLSGSWNVNAESAILQAAPGKIVFRFHSRDLHLVLAPAKHAKPVRFVGRLDGRRSWRKLRS